jgi:Spy/CpxP family protein refolding chaperone
MMSRGMGSRWLAAGCLLASVVLLPAAGAWARQEEDRPGDGKSMHEDLQETIEIYMVARMKRSLDLSGEQERIVIPLVEQINSTRRDTNRRRRLLMMKLRPLIEDESSSDRDITRLIDELVEMEREFRDEEVRSRGQIRAALNPRQQARFIVFQERFRQEMENRVRRLQEGEGPRPAGPRRSLPPPDRPRPR